MMIDAPTFLEVIAVPQETFVHARAEMEVRSKARGFPLPQDEMLRRQGRDNFLIFGKPVVAA